MEIVDLDPSEVLAALPEEHRVDMEALDALIRSALPDRVRTVWQGKMWGGTDQTILGYGDIRQPRPKGPDVEWFLVGLARQKQHASIYVNAAEDGQYLGQRFADRLGKVKIGSASIGIRSLDGVDTDVLVELLRRADELTPPDPS